MNVPSPTSTQLLLATVAVVASDPTEDLFLAVRKDDPSLIAKALQEGADINTQNPENEQSPLMNAILQGKIEAVKYLLAAGADTSLAEQDGYTPMHGAGFQGRAEIVKLLVNAGLDPNDKHSDGFTPIQRACWGDEQRYTDTVAALLELGATQAGGDGKGKRLIDTCAPPGSKAILQAHRDKMKKNRQQEL